MSHFLLGCALGAAIVASIAAPFLAPWPLRVRYLANAQTVDPLLGFGPIPRLDIRVATLVSVEAAQGHVELVLADAEAGPAAPRTTLIHPSCPPATIARLDGCAAMHTPLLVIVDEDHCLHLFGADHIAADLAVAKELVR